MESIFSFATLGVDTLGVDLSASCLGEFMRKYGIFCRCRGSWHRMSSRVSDIFEYYRKIITKPKIFTDTQTQDSFLVCDPSSCNLLFEANNLGIGAFFCHALFLTHCRLPQPESNLGHFLPELLPSCSLFVVSENKHSILSVMNS